MGCAIVAIPDDRDHVWDISSEKIPHMTLLFLGEVKDGQDEISQFVQHVAETSLQPFGLSVKKRGLLGDEDADVLFFNKDDYQLPNVERARSFLLTNPHIRKAYESAFQYPEWTPHLTLGYPKTPAKKDKEENRYSLSWVEFDKIAVWFDDFSGPTFDLEHKPEEAMEVSMSDSVDDFLEHYGVKGMRWGVIRDRAAQLRTGQTDVKITKRPGKRVETSGGHNRTPSDDAVKTAISKQIAKKSSLDALSTKDLQDLVTRMNLEQQYANLTSKNNKSALNKGMNVFDEAMKVNDKITKVDNFLKSPGGKLVKEIFGTALKAKLKK